ncbi:hypothetical protein PVAND_006094 [Polypedilum vanderplanki]|uniref:Fucosyltransferase n=1 Tax=Polypedilum vanderplanki TaxID=319348 RepID=A0A9J6C2Y1_POLVA|nr:hypothetical protein PVAND_006094 [Polypedilum vanderplanki]
MSRSVKFSDKIKLVPDNDVHRSYSLPKRKLKFFFFLVLMTIIILFFCTSHRNVLPEKLTFFNESHSEQVFTDNENDTYIDYNISGEMSVKNSTKNILFWTRFFNNTDWYTGEEEAGEEVLKSVQCPVTNCFFTHNKELLDGDITKFDAIAFHGPEFRTKPLPTVRSPDQLYIFVSLESPTAVIDDLTKYKDFYNLTMTYRLDSDIEFDYGKVISIDTEKVIAPSKNPNWHDIDEDFYDEKLMEMFKKKKSNIAWFVSNCFTRSRRSILVKKMQNLTTVDIYGQCGPLKCKVDTQECLDMLTSDYKFYLSFENSLCKDYITEKIYRPLTQYVIPIVFNGGNTTLFAPPKSFINANDYDTVEDLVNYLEFLNNNPKEYIKYFWWKRYYYIKSHPVYQYTLCELCTKLNDETFMKSSHRYPDINAWYKNDMCDQNAHIKF